MLQSFIPFLDKERYLTVRFFETFSHQGTKESTVSLAELQNKLAVSSYKLQQVISTAQHICQQVTGLNLEQTSAKELTLTGLDSLKLKKIILFEAHHSLRFKIFIHIALRPKEYSDSEFQQKHGISRATYFRIKSLLLDEIGAEIKNNINYSEAYTRYYIYNVIYYFSFLDFIDDSSEKKELTASINYIIMTLKLSPTNLQRKQHLYFVVVNYWRSKNGHIMSANDENFFITFKKTPAIRKCLEHLHKFWAKSEIGATRIANSVLTFLVTIEELNVNILQSLQDYDLVNELTQQQIALIEGVLGENFAQLNPLSLTDKLLKVNAKMLVPFYLDTSYNGMKNWDFYEDSYLSIARLAKELLQCRADFKSVRPMGENEATQFYYSYLFTIFSEIPTTAFSDQVRIAVDFSQGIEYTDYIKKKLVEMALLNIQIDKFVSPRTDIYLTNNFDPTFKNYQIVWDHPPLTKEMVDLRELIVKVKNAKHKGSTANN